MESRIAVRITARESPGSIDQIRSPPGSAAVAAKLVDAERNCGDHQRLNRRNEEGGLLESIHRHGVRRLPGLDNAHSPRRRSVSFTLDGRSMRGLEGEPVAIALMAAGVRVMRTMPGSGEMRGGFCFVGRCADCLMVIDGRAGVKSCLTPLVEGMQVETLTGLGHGPEVDGR